MEADTVGGIDFEASKPVTKTSTIEVAFATGVRVSVNAPRNITIARKKLIECAEENKDDKLEIYELRKKVLSR